ncbi:MAG: glycosyltransferase family 2 protein [Solirubrobacteraceae bacterium]
MNVNDDVTVAIACFNYGAFLAEAVESALAQKGGEPRVIVVDDGSSDPGTLAALERLPPQVRVLRQENAGVAVARNVALAGAQTPYVLVLDADDRLTPEAVGLLRPLLEDDPEIGFAYGPMRFFGAWEGELRLPPYDPYGLLFRHNIGATALMRRELVEDVGGYDPSFSGYEDWELWVHALERGWRGRRIEQVTLMYRRHESTRHMSARPGYHRAFRRLRRKHPRLYDREGRRRLAAESALGPGQRLLYRFVWGWRPLPARLELALQSLLWRPKDA